MKFLPWILVCLLLGVIVWMQCNPHDPSTVYIKGDTVRIRDTIRDTIPKPAKRTPKRIDTVYLPILIDATTVITVESFSDRIKVCALDIIEIHAKRNKHIYFIPSI